MKNEETMTQLDLFGGTGALAAGPAQGGAETASQAAPGVQAPTKNTGRAGAALVPPRAHRFRPAARSPAGRTCHRDSCRHYRPAETGGLCAHPEARLPAAGGVRGNRLDERSATATATITCDDSPRLPGCYVN